MRINHENRDLIHNRNVTASHLDDHMLHIVSHLKIFENPVYKNDSAIYERVMKHIGEHTMYIKSMIEL